MPPQPFACSLKLPKRKGVEGRSEKKGRRISQKREKRTMHQKRTGPETMPAYTHKHGELYTNTRTNKCQPTTERWVFGPPEFSCLPVADSPYRIASTVHQTWGRERNFLSPRIGCLPARPLASALRRLGPPPPFIGGFLLRQIPSCFPAGPRIYTVLSCSA